MKVSCPFCGYSQTAKTHINTEGDCGDCMVVCENNYCRASGPQCSSKAAAIRAFAYRRKPTEKQLKPTDYAD